MRQWLTVLAVVAAAASVTGVTRTAGGKLAYKKELGMASCTTCHTDGKDKKEANATNKLWAKAKDQVTQLKEQKGAFAGKKTCNDCHNGKQVPAK